ncbi:MAG: DUF1579 domain-containing protein [Pseudomonadota bacterium]|nr:DUF1579 domain-containing protein [Pseudomonadota bacterium]
MRLAALAIIIFAAGPLAAQAVPPSPPVPVTAETADTILAMEAGTWDADITFPSNEAGKPDSKAKGVQVNRLRSGGKWIINEFSVEGSPYEGTGVWGYDRTKGRFSGIWVDNNDRQIRLDDGRWDAATKTMTWSANMAQPDGAWMRLLFTEKFEGNIRRFDMVALTRRGEVPLVRMVFTKRA